MCRCVHECMEVGQVTLTSYLMCWCVHECMEVEQVTLTSIAISSALVHRPQLLFTLQQIYANQDTFDGN